MAILPYPLLRWDPLGYPPRRSGGARLRVWATTHRREVDMTRSDFALIQYQRKAVRGGSDIFVSDTNYPLLRLTIKWHHFDSFFSKKEIIHLFLFPICCYGFVWMKIFVKIYCWWNHFWLIVWNLIFGDLYVQTWFVNNRKIWVKFELLVEQFNISCLESYDTQPIKWIEKKRWAGYSKGNRRLWAKISESLHRARFAVFCFNMFYKSWRCLFQCVLRSANFFLFFCVEPDFVAAAAGHFVWK